MKKSALVLILAQFAASSASLAVDLTPHYLDIANGSVADRVLYFNDGTKKIGVTLDRETEVVAEAGSVSFFFTTLPGTNLNIRESTLTTEVPFSDKSLELYRSAALLLVPKGIKDAKIESEESDPIPVNNWHSYRFVFAYYTGTVAAKRSVTFLNVSEKQQLILVVTATAQNFAAAAVRSHQIICSWHELQPSEQKPTTGN